VVAVDGSRHSEGALARAVDYVQLARIPLRVVCAWGIPATFGGTLAYTTLIFHRQAAEDLPASVGDLVPEGVEMDSSLVEGYPADVLTQAAGEASLLVLGSRGRGGVADMLLGSVSRYSIPLVRAWDGFVSVKAIEASPQPAATSRAMMSTRSVGTPAAAGAASGRAASTGVARTTALPAPPRPGVRVMGGAHDRGFEGCHAWEWSVGPARATATSSVR
jgi:nucleotide-binding universal stress UspA family protein